MTPESAPEALCCAKMKTLRTSDWYFDLGCVITKNDLVDWRMFVQRKTLPSLQPFDYLVGMVKSRRNLHAPSSSFPQERLKLFMVLIAHLGTGSGHLFLVGVERHISPISLCSDRVSSTSLTNARHD